MVDEASGIAGSIPSTVTAVLMWDAQAYVPIPAIVDAGTYYFDEAHCSHCVLQFRLGDGRTSRVGVTLSKSDHYSTIERDISVADLRIGLAVKGSPFNAPETLVEGPRKSIWVLDRLGNRVALITLNRRAREIELPTPFSDPGDIIATPSFVWIAERQVGRIVRLSLDGSYKEYQLQASIGLGDLKIVAGHGDQVYFVHGRDVGMIEDAIDHAQYFRLDPVAVLTGLAVTKDGTIWVSGLASWSPHVPSFLASLNSSGLWQRFNIGDAVTQIEPAKSGLWLARSTDNYLSFFSWSGGEHVVDMPVERLGPILYTIGISNDAWFSDRYGNVIGHATPTGITSATYTNFGPANISDMRLDAGGNLWIAEPGNRQIEELGKSNYLPPPGVSPKYLLFDSSGVLWYSDPDADVIGTIGKGAPTKCYAFRLSHIRNCAFDHADLVP